MPQVLVSSVMSIYEGVRTRFRVEFELSPFLFVIVVDVVTELAGESMSSELLMI